MTLKSNIISGAGKKYSATVSKRGQLITSPLDFSELVFHTLDTDNTPDTWFGPKAGKSLIITDLIVQTSRDVVTTGVTVDIYEAIAENSSTIDKQLFQFDMERQQTIIINGLNIITNEGKFINAKASDSDVLITIGGYFVKT